MKASFLGAATYGGTMPPGHAWPVAPEACDREMASFSMHRTIENCRRAEELGFDWISVSEHHYAPTMLTPNPLVMAGALTQALKTAKIALLGPLMPLNNPVRLAEEIAMLDSMSDGRVIVLFLRGLAFEHATYTEVGPQSRGITQEGIDLVIKAWTEPQPFAWAGEHFQYKSVAIWPRTRQVPHPPVFGSGNSDESAIFAAERRLGLAMSFMPASRVASMVALYKDAAARAGWTPGPDHVLYRGLCTIADTDGPDDSLFDTAEAKARAEGGEAPVMVRGAYFTGGPRNVLRQIESLREAGVGIIDMSLATAVGAVDYDAQAAATELFARKVLPEIRSW
jgi:alkanesulfonate monooxygenase SsuD/methylene tetrahydromethanopterin reductase-like flavin-dependent oxidoreductase (luciferase family)